MFVVVQWLSFLRLLILDQIVVLLSYVVEVLIYSEIAISSSLTVWSIVTFLPDVVKKFVVKIQR